MRYGAVSKESWGRVHFEGYPRAWDAQPGKETIQFSHHGLAHIEEPGGLSWRKSISNFGADLAPLFEVRVQPKQSVSAAFFAALHDGSSSLEPIASPNWSLAWAYLSIEGSAVADWTAAFRSASPKGDCDILCHCVIWWWGQADLWLIRYFLLLHTVW